MEDQALSRRQCLLRVVVAGVGAATLGAQGCFAPVRQGRGRKRKTCYTITAACTRCGSCVDECPTEAISEGYPIYTIDRDTCLCCGACAEACPVGAIKGSKWPLR